MAGKKTKKKTETKTVAPVKIRRDKRDVIKPKEPTLAEQVFGVLGQLFFMWIVSTFILFALRKFNIAQPKEVVSE